jgi:hypothetical protein
VAVRPPELCLSGRELEDFVFDRLSGDTRQTIEEHVLACPDCVERIWEEEDYVLATRAAARLIGAVGVQPAPPPSRWRSGVSLVRRLTGWWNWRPAWVPPFAAAGAIAALAFLIAVPWQRSAGGYSTVPLVTMRGESHAIATASGRERIRLHMDLTELPSLPAYRIELAGAAGSILRQATLNPHGQSLDWRVGRLDPGQYWIRVADGATGELLREYGLLVAR